MTIKTRQISESLLKMLDKDGSYHEITEIVRIDPYLDMEMRGKDGAIVYYRGGKLLTIHEKKGLVGLDNKYYLGNETTIVTPDKDDIFGYVCKAKFIMDKYESVKSKLIEKEFQQRVVYENNLSGNADNTDYFIVDVEWANSNVLGGRADIVAFRWNHMEHKKRLIQLTLIEVKQGEKAIKTTETIKDGKKQKSPGLTKHYEDYLKLKSDKEAIRVFKNDMLGVLKQKYQLGLTKGLDNLFHDRDKKINPELENDIDFVFLLANYHHYSSALREECESLPDDCKFYIASFMGYGLYKDRIYTKNKIKEIYQDTFTNKRL